MVTVTVESVVVNYTIKATTSKGEKTYCVRDDGWALYVTTPDRISVGRVSFGTESKRTPDVESARQALERWLSGDMAGV